jgi:hypothetical protein
MSTRLTIVHLEGEERVVHLYDDTWEGAKDCVTLDLGGKAVAGFRASHSVSERVSYVSLVVPVAVWDELIDAVVARRAEDAQLRAEQLARQAACPGHVYALSELVRALNPGARPRCTRCHAPEPLPASTPAQEAP